MDRVFFRDGFGSLSVFFLRFPIFSPCGQKLKSKPSRIRNQHTGCLYGCHFWFKFFLPIFCPFFTLYQQLVAFFAAVELRSVSKVNRIEFPNKSTKTNSFINQSHLDFFFPPSSILWRYNYRWFPIPADIKTCQRFWYLQPKTRWSAMIHIFMILWLIPPISDDLSFASICHSSANSKGLRQTDPFFHDYIF